MGRIIGEGDCLMFGIVYMIEVMGRFGKRDEKYVGIFRRWWCGGEV